MRRGHGRSAIAAVILATLLVPAVGAVADDPAEQLEETRSKLSEVRENIEALEGEVGDLNSTIKELGNQMVDLRSIISDLDGQIADNQRELDDVQARIDATQAKINKIERAATAQAVALYKNGTTETIDALLSAQSLTELDTRVDMLGQASEENTGFLIEYGRLKVSIQDQFREKFAIQETLKQTRSEKTAAFEELATVTERHRVALEKVENNLGKAEEHEGELEEKEGQLAQKIMALQAAAAPLPGDITQPVQSFSSSAAGFIWPLNGPVTSYFGPRWGRMHEGIDIDGTTGQPLVASKAGRVILAAPYSGYGNAVIVDHGDGFSTLYAHMSAFAVSNGTVVSQGQTVGYVGCTGSCTGDHTHFEIRDNGVAQDPMAYLP